MTKSNGTPSPEDRRALEELTSAYQQVEAENRRLRAQLEHAKKVIGAGSAGPPGAKPSKRAGQVGPASSGVSAEKALPVPGQLVQVDVKVPPKPGKLVDYIDERGQDHLALVLDQRAGALKVKVFYRAVPNVVVEVPEQSAERRVECWRSRNWKAPRGY